MLVIYREVNGKKEFFNGFRPIPGKIGEVTFAELWNDGAAVFYTENDVQQTVDDIDGPCLVGNLQILVKNTGSYFAERPIGDAECVTFDHSVNKFEVEIRSMSIGINDLKDHIQKKYEVTNISEVSRTPCYKV